MIRKFAKVMEENHFPEIPLGRTLNIFLSLPLTGFEWWYQLG